MDLQPYVHHCLAPWSSYTMDLTAETSPRSYCSTLWYLPEVLNLFDWNVYNIFISFYKCCLESPLVCFVCWSRLGWVFIVGPPHWLGSLWLHCSLFLTVVSVLNQYRFQPLPTVWTLTLKEKKKKQVTGYLLPERLLLPSKVAYGIVLSLPLVSWPRGRVLDSIPHPCETSPPLHSSLPYVIIFSSMAPFSKGLKICWSFATWKSV